MSKVVVVKLSTSEEVIAKLVDSTVDVESAIKQDSVIVIRDAKCMMIQGSGQHMGMTMIPYMLSAIEGEVKLRGSAVLSWVTEDKLPKQLLDAYLSQTSGIQIQQRI